MQTRAEQHYNIGRSIMAFVISRTLAEIHSRLQTDVIKFQTVLCAACVCGVCACMCVRPHKNRAAGSGVSSLTWLFHFGDDLRHDGRLAAIAECHCHATWVNNYTHTQTHGHTLISPDGLHMGAMKAQPATS